MGFRKRIQSENGAHFFPRLCLSVEVYVMEAAAVWRTLGGGINLFF